MKNVIHILRKYPFWALGLLLICGCDVVQDIISEPSGDMDAPPLHVTMIYPSDCVGDSSYCDSFHIGVRTAEAELGISLTEVAGMESDPAVTEMQLREAAQNSDLVLAIGYQMGEPLSRVAPEFPDIKFAIFDVVLALPNVASINYKANEGSFLVGAIAGLKSEGGKIGYIGGVDVPLLREFEAGYVAGVYAVNPDAVVSIAYISEDIGGFNQPDKAKEIALTQYEGGVDVIYTAAGGSGLGVLQAAQEQGKYVIWVDSNGNHLAPGTVLTSMVKQIENSVYGVISETIDGTFMGGIRYLGLAEGGVDYALDEHNRSELSDEIIATVESLRAKIIAGEIVVPNEVPLPR
jgi:basic membrane protein A